MNEDQNSNTRVLIVEDQQDVLLILQKVIDYLGFEMDIACDGEVAIKKLSENDFAIVISDINMPKLDGVQLLKHIKATYTDIDVLISTGYPQDYQQKDIMTDGATDYIVKPFSVVELSQKLKDIVSKRQLSK